MALISNNLIALLPAKDRKRLLDRCETVQLELGQLLAIPGDKTQFVYFPTESFISLITTADEHTGVEVGMVGSEGLLGSHLVLGLHTHPLRALVQGAGSALRMSRTAFLEEFKRSAALQKVLHRYLYILMTQLTTTAACLRFHQVGPRLARWLLMSQDRAHSNRFQMTQEFLAVMLGVRRVGVTAAASLMQMRGLISYQRGQLTILDREGMKAAACSCYAKDCATYGEGLGAAPGHPPLKK